ncbi:MAG TPA: response regulator [Chloroflexi bacterium]|nr:response regulator [Chloroflexota bacterium]
MGMKSENNKLLPKHLREALNHLYDLGRLRHSPLIPLFGLMDRFDAPASLQRLLIDAIEALKPSIQTPNLSSQRQIYDLLLYRYVQQFSQQEVANQLGISVRHLRRIQQTALESLAYHLWKKFDLANQPDVSETVEGDELTPSESPFANSDTIVDDELAWLQSNEGRTTTDLSPTLSAVLALAKPMAAQYRVTFAIALPDDLPHLAAHPVAVRQMLLNLLTAAIPYADGPVSISVHLHDWEVELRVSPMSSGASGTVHPEEIIARLKLTRRLATISGGQLVLSDSEASEYEARLILPAAEQIPVLVVDDNTDALQLLQRFLASTRYHFIGVQDPYQTIALAEQFAPQIIVLDVMMPQLDGWELLGRLRQHPRTSHIPIVVHTILPQEELALSLGASAFIQKPVTRQAFLAALDQLTRPAEQSEPGRL